MAAEEENNLLGAEVDSPSPGSKESPWSQGYRGQRRRETAKSWIIVCLSITTLMSVALAALPMLSFEPKGSAGAGIYQALPSKPVTNSTKLLALADLVTQLRSGPS